MEKVLSAKVEPKRKVVFFGGEWLAFPCVGFCHCAHVLTKSMNVSLWRSLLWPRHTPIAELLLVVGTEYVIFAWLITIKMIKMVQNRNFYGSMKASEINCLDISAGFPLNMDHYRADQKPWFFTAKSPMGKQFRTLALQDSVSCHPLWRSCTVWMAAFTYIAGVVVDAAVREKRERLYVFFWHEELEDETWGGIWIIGYYIHT